MLPLNTKPTKTTITKAEPWPSGGRTLRRAVAAVVALVSLAGSATASSEDLPAFPGATGFGKMATGWRGGRIVHVTNLADRGPGSFRTCAEDRTGPRVCVFDTSGTISLDSSVRIAPNTYIAGQTAPGDGIQIKLGKSQNTPLVIKNADSVLIRFLKSRPGASSGPSVSVDGVTVEDSQSVYLDHMSIQFATDENFNVHANKRPTRDITVARSIIAWGLDHANHPKGKHSKGALICSTEGKTGECGRVSLVGNLFAHNRDRNPDVKGTDTGPIEIVNNVFYDAKSQFGEFYNLIGDTKIYYVGNLALAGPSTRSSPPPAAIEAFFWKPQFRLEVIADDNLNVRRPGCGQWKNLDVVDARAKPFVHAEPVQLTFDNVVPAADVFEHVLATAGARKAGGEQTDALDQSLIDQVRECGGKVVDDVSETMGWPEFPVVEAPADRDRDGMPDDWEAAHGLDLDDPADTWADRDGDGWSNIEEYLNELAS